MKSGWAIKKLGDVCEFRRGLTYAKSDEVEASDKVVLRANNVSLESSTLCFDELKYLRTDFNIPADKLLVKDGLLICTASGSKDHLGKVAYIDREYGFAFGGFMGLLVPRSAIVFPRYCYRLLTSSAYKDFIKGLTDGANINNLKFSQLAEFEIPVPPLAEQKRIVAKIDAAFEKIDKLKANAERNLANAKELFQSALDEAMRPERGWEEKRLGEVCKVFGRGKSKHRPRNDKRLYGGPYPFIQTGDVRNAGHTIDKFTQTYSEFGLSQSKLWPKGTLCITIAANIAETAILGFDACFPDSVIGCVFDESKMHTGFAEYMLQNYKCQLQSLGKDRSSAQPNINLGTFEDNAFPAPPLAEQRQIVKRLDSLSEKVRLLEQHYTRQIADCAEMRQSVLREAFEGRL